MAKQRSTNFKQHKPIVIFAFSLFFVMLTSRPVTAQWVTNGNDIYNSNTGNVGIGTTSPSYKLDISSSAANDHGVNLSMTGTGSVAGFNVNVTGGATTNYGVYSNAAGATTNYSFYGNAGTLYNAGSVGIGTTAPAERLDVNGGARILGGAYLRLERPNNDYHWRIYNNGGNSLRVENHRSDNGGLQADAMTIQDNGNVGIGTTTPSTKLHVAGNVTVGSSSVAAFDVNSPNPSLILRSGTNGYDPNISFLAPDGTQNALIDGNSSTGFYLVAARPNLPIVLRTVSPGGAVIEAMRLDGAGNVGIGTTTPSSRLHVVGDVTVTGSISAKYQDIAEWVPATTPLMAGTVVILDSNHTNYVITSSEPYDTRVAGIVSSSPGLVLGEADVNKVKVATTGRVRVRVDATPAPIRAGDLLVTSEKQGMAMRSEPVEVAGIRMHRPGTLIGKALEPLESGEGEILVLLSLQ